MQIKEFWDAVKIFKSVLKCSAFHRFKSFSLFISPLRVMCLMLVMNSCCNEQQRHKPLCNMTAVPYPLFYWRVCPCSWLMNRGFPNCNTCSIINDFISERSTKHRIINLTMIHDHKVHPYYRYYKILILFVKKKKKIL